MVIFFLSLQKSCTYLHDLPKGRENQAGRHCGRKSLSTIHPIISINGIHGTLLI
jgi:hypothetical protein